MAETTQPQVPRQVQNLFNKGFSAFERGNHGVAIDLLSRCAQLSPGFTRARRFLRAAQVQRYRKQGAGVLGRLLAPIRGAPHYLKVKTLVQAGRPADALVPGERMLSVNPLNRGYVLLFAEAALGADQVDAAQLTLETAREQHPDDPDIIRELGRLHDRTGDYNAAKKCYEKLIELRPHDPDVLKLLKDAMAHETMGAGWNRVGDEDVGARDLVKDQEQTRMLDLKGKAVKTGEDTDALIEETRAKIEEDPKNLNYYRSLARLLLQSKQFEEAIETLDAARKINPSDPELDRARSQAKLAHYDYRIETLRAQEQNETAHELEQERRQFAFDDLMARVERYPNDLRLRYELGLQYFQNDYFDEAIQQFQLSQRSPKDRVDSLYHLALCFRAKGQLDMAVQQLEQALELLPGMDDERKDVLYALGELAEAAGDAERAEKLFKEIYRVDIGFRDVANKIEKAYATRESGE